MSEDQDEDQDGEEDRDMSENVEGTGGVDKEEQKENEVVYLQMGVTCEGVG